MPGNPSPLPESLRAIEPPQRPVNRDDPSTSPNDHTREHWRRSQQDSGFEPR